MGVLSVFAGLVAIVIVTGVGFVGSSDEPAGSDPDDTVAGAAEARPDGSTPSGPTTALIRGAVTTTLFVTTTTPITTTTTTTTTTLPGPVLETGDPVVTFAEGARTATFTVHSASPEGLEFAVTELPAGIEASPARARVAADAPATVTLRITDPGAARSGDFVLAGDDGTRVTVLVVVPDAEVSIAGVGFDPDPVVCGTRTSLVVVVAGAGPSAVRADLSWPGGETNLSLSETRAGVWSAPMPTVPAGMTLSGTVSATGPGGEVAARNFSTPVAGEPGCGR